MSETVLHPSDLVGKFLRLAEPGKLPEFLEEAAIAKMALKAESFLADQHGWPEPTPLPDPLPKVARFNEALLPEVLRPWVMDIANRMQCPPDYPAVAALVAL
jgi:hypothetical protein